VEEWNGNNPFAHPTKFGERIKISHFVQKWENAWAISWYQNLNFVKTWTQHLSAVNHQYIIYPEILLRNWTINRYALCAVGLLETSLHCVSKNEPTLSSCSFDKHGLILIIFGQQHQHTFEYDMHIQLSLSLYFYLLYLLLNSCDGNDAKRHVPP